MAVEPPAGGETGVGSEGSAAAHGGGAVGVVLFAAAFEGGDDEVSYGDLSVALSAGRLEASDAPVGGQDQGGCEEQTERRSKEGGAHWQDSWGAWVCLRL